MSRRWLLALFALAVGACTCPPAEAELKAFAPAKIYQDAIKQCEAYGNCDSLCISLFSLDTSRAAVEHCAITHVDDTGASVKGLIQYDNVCAADGDFVIGDDGSYVDDGGDDGTVDDGSNDGTTDDGSNDGTTDDGSNDSGGSDDGSTGDDGGDDGGGDDGSFAPKHHQVVKHQPTGSRA
jgi:hypothetical protein